MVSEIKGGGAPTIASVEPSLRKLGSTAPAGATPGTGASDVVTLTDLAARLQQLTASVGRLPVVDQVRVAEFKRAVDGGDYRIDDRQIADKLAAFEVLLSRESQIGSAATNHADG